MSFQTRLSPEPLERFTRSGHWGSETLPSPPAEP